jgi:hypothetical protein
MHGAFTVHSNVYQRRKTEKKKWYRIVVSWTANSTPGKVAKPSSMILVAWLPSEWKTHTSFPAVYSGGRHVSVLYRSKIVKSEV